MAVVAPEQLRRELETLSRLLSLQCIYAPIHRIGIPYNYYILYRCRHHNLVDMMGFCVAPPIIVYELMDCTLYDKLHSEVYLTNTRCLMIIHMAFAECQPT